MPRRCGACRGDVSAHAKDIWTSATGGSPASLPDCAWLVTCTRLGLERLQQNRAPSGTPESFYHGLDRSPTCRLRPWHLPARRLGRGKPGLSSCRSAAGRKKGYDDLLDALGQAARRPALALRAHRRRRRDAEGAGSAVGHCRALHMARRQPQRRCSPRSARADLFVCWPARRPPTASG